MEAAGDEEQLLDELLETCDRIQARLNEAQLAVAEKDRDYMRREHEELSSPRRETGAHAERDCDRAGPGHAEEEEEEKDMYGAVVEGFLREINVESPVLKDSSSQPSADNSCTETESMKDETGSLHSSRCVPDLSHEETESLIEEKIDSEVRFDLHGVLHTAMFRDLVSKRGVRDQTRKLTEEKDELDMRNKLQYEICTTVFKDLVSNLAVESVEHVIRAYIKDEVHTVVVDKLLNEWKSTTEMVHNERLIKEEIDRIVFGELTKDLMRGHNLSLLKPQDEIRGINNLGRFSIIDNFDQLQKMKMHISVTNGDKGIDSINHQVPVKQEIFSNSNNCDGEDSIESDLQAEPSTDKVQVSDSVNSNIEQAFEEQDHRKLQTGDVALCLSIPPNLENGCLALTLDEKHGIKHSLAPNAILGKHYQLNHQSSLSPFTNFQKSFMDFEAVTGDKIGTAMLRLRHLDGQLANLVEQVSSLKRSELTYRRAFSRRCHDLQTAETEVDLLGDEVELLLGLLSKTYEALDHYSPVLQHYVGIREVLKLLGKELAVRHQVQ